MNMKHHNIAFRSNYLPHNPEVSKVKFNSKGKKKKKKDYRPTADKILT